MAISLPLPSFLFPLSPHLCLQVGWLSLRDKMADNFIVNDRQLSNDTKPTEVNHGLIIDVYAARTSTHACSISLSFPLHGLHIIPNLAWSTRPSPTSQRQMFPPCGLSHPDSHCQCCMQAIAKCFLMRVHGNQPSGHCLGRRASNTGLRGGGEDGR